MHYGKRCVYLSSKYFNLGLLNTPFNENSSVLKQSYSLEKMHCIIFLKQLFGPLIILIRLPIF